MSRAKIITTITIFFFLSCIGIVRAQVDDNFDSYINGDIETQSDWYVSGSGDWYVQDSIFNTDDKAVYCDDSFGYSQLFYDFTTATTTGTQVFYAYFTDNTDGGNFYLMKNGSSVCGFHFLDDIKLVAYNGATLTTLVDNYSEGVWYKIQVQWNTIDDECRAKIDNNLWSDWYSYNTDVADIDSINLMSTSIRPVYYDTFIGEEVLGNDINFLSPLGDLGVGYPYNINWLGDYSLEEGEGTYNQIAVEITKNETTTTPETILWDYIPIATTTPIIREDFNYIGLAVGSGDYSYRAKFLGEIFESDWFYADNESQYWTFSVDDTPYETSEEVSCFQNLFNSIKYKAPFGYFYRINEVFNGFNASTTPIAVFDGLEAFTPIFSPIRSAFEWLLWLFVGVALFKRLKNVDL